MRTPHAHVPVALLLGLMVLTAARAGEPALAADQAETSPGQTSPGGMKTPDETRRGGMMGPGMMGGGMMGGGMGMASQGRPWVTIMLNHQQELGLSPDQVNKLSDLRDGFQRAAQEKGEEIEQAEDDLGALLGPRPIDLAAAEAKLKRLEALRTELQLTRLKAIEEGKRLLTPDQQAKLVRLADQEGSPTGVGAMGPGQAR